MKALLLACLILIGAPVAQAETYEEHDYLLNCSGCHKADGAGSPLVPSLHAMRELANHPGARDYWIQVPGAAQAPLTDQRLAALMNWLVKRFTGKPPSPPYTAKEVGHLRSAPLRDPLAKRSQLLKAPDASADADAGPDADTDAGAEH